MPLIIEQPGLQDLKAGIQQLKDEGIAFDQAVLLLSQSHGLTWNAAADRVRGAMAITGIWLDGEGWGHQEPAKVGAADQKEARAHEPPPAQRSEAATQDTETLFCTICGDPIPEARARRQTATCSEKCKNRLDTIRAHQREAKKCPACLHPSTPEERESYRLWRANRGDILSTGLVERDRTLPNKKYMALALQRAAKELQETADTLAAQLGADALEVKPGPGIGIPEMGRKQAEAKLKRVTNLIRECEAMATPKGQLA